MKRGGAFDVSCGAIALPLPSTQRVYKMCESINKQKHEEAMGWKVGVSGGMRMIGVGFGATA